MRESAKKTLLLNIILLLVIIFLIFILVYNFKITKLEKVKIEEFNKNAGIYLDEYIDYDDKGKYIIFSIEYLNGKTNRNDFTTKEVIDTINDTFNINYTEKNIYKIGITERMLEKGIVYDDANKKFIFNNKKTRQDIANEKIVKYELNSIKKRSKNRFVLTYDKYEVEDPYKILNYFNSLGSKKGNIKKSNIVLSYLKTEGNIRDVKNIINKDNIKEFGKINGRKKVILRINNDKLIIDRVK